MKPSEVKNKYSALKKLEKRANYLYKHNYEKYIYINYNKLLIDKIIFNGSCHLTSIFKNVLIEEDYSEFLFRFYKINEIIELLQKLCYFHLKIEVIFPNYFPLIEKKYLYNNVFEKQKVIDKQVELEKQKKNNPIVKNEQKNNNNQFFTSSIFNSSESIIRIIFGINKKQNLKKNLINNKEIRNNKNSQKSDINEENDSNDINCLIEEINKGEEKINNNNKINKNSIEFNSNNNNIKKPKLQ